MKEVFIALLAALVGFTLCFVLAAAPQPGRYQRIPQETSIVIFDTATGDLWWVGPQTDNKWRKLPSIHDVR